MNKYNNIKSVLNTNKKIIWLYNIGVEDFWHGGSISIKDNSSVKIVNEMEDMNILVSSSDDIAIMRNMPSDYYLQYMKRMGFSIPSIFVINNDDASKSISELVLEDKELLNKLSKLKNDYVLCPYGISSLEEQIASITGLELMGGTSDLAMLVNDKIFAREVSNALGFNTTLGYKCKYEEIEEKINYLFDNYNYKKVIVKAPCGASGKGLYLIEDKKAIKRTLLILKRFHSNEEFFLVEGWIENKKDYNYQLYVDNTSTKVFSIKEQIVDKTIYTGSLFQIDNNVEVDILAKGEMLGNYMREKYNYTGFLGVDCLTDNGQLVPILEINGRFTLSTYLSFISNIFGDKYFYSFYKNVNELSFKVVIEKIEASNLQYNKEIGKGAICYVEGALQEKGRLFILIIGNSNDDIKDIYDKLINELNLGA